MPLLFAAACQQAPEANQAVPAPKAWPAPPESDVAAAERLVRAKIGAAGNIQFVAAQRTAAQGVGVVCGAYQQGGTRQRYIVVDRDPQFVWVEPQMRAGEMDRAVAQFCTTVNDNHPAPVLNIHDNGTAPPTVTTPPTNAGNRQ